MLKLSPEVRAKIEAEKAELLRMWGLTDRFLAADLLRKARMARTLYPEQFVRDGYGTYTTSLVWDVIPEVAYRLGSRDLQSGERREDVRACTDDDLRDWLGHCLNWAPTIKEAFNSPSPIPDPWEMLTREPQQGNPVLFALDRICPPDIDSTDRGAKLLREVSRARGLEETSAWHPGLDRYRAQQSDDEDVRDADLSMF